MKEILKEIERQIVMLTLSKNYHMQEAYWKEKLENLQGIVNILKSNLK